MPHFVYILASRPNGAIYIGRTEQLRSRVQAHQMGLSRHTAKYNIRHLVWFERHEAFETSLRRERSIKRWRRSWKNALIAEKNPEWVDLSRVVFDLD